jgi:large subunit ribosomal protein L9
MRVLFLEDVEGVAQGGEVKDVKRGFARNYLIPKRLATPATRDSMQRAERLGKQADSTRLKRLTDMRALSEELNGAQVNVEMRAGASGRLYGSVTNAIVAAKLSELTEQEIDRRSIEIPDSIRKVGRYELRVLLHSEVDANIALLVYPAGTDPAEFAEALLKEAEEKKQKEEEEGDDDAGDQVTPEASIEEQAVGDAPAEEQSMAEAPDDEAAAGDATEESEGK